MLIRDMKPGQWGFVRYWGIEYVGGKPLLYLDYEVETLRSNAASVLLERTKTGYVAKGWKPWKPEVHAVISIITRKYPWTGATDEDVAPVVLEDA